MNEDLEEVRRALTNWVNYEIDGQIKFRTRESIKAQLNKSVEVYGFYEGGIPKVQGIGAVYIYEDPHTISDAGYYLRWLATLGWQREKETKPETRGSTLVWRLSHVDFTEKVQLEATFGKGDNAEDVGACKMVQMGTRNQEIPIFELVCPDGGKPEDLLEVAI